MPQDIFISYSHEDQAIAEQVVASLETAGMSCWISSRDEMPGEIWSEKISQALDKSKIVVFILSAKSNTSDGCKNELALARDKGKPIVPLRIEDIPPADDVKYFFARVQRLDAITRPIDKYLNDLVKTSRNFMESLLSEDSLTQRKIEVITESANDSVDLSAEAQRTGSNLVQVWTKKATQACELGLYPAAVRYYDKILATDPQDPKILNSKALALMKVDSFQAAVDCCESATCSDPDFIEAWKNMGICLQKLNHPDEALECYEKALDIEPLDAAANGLKGSACLDLNQNDVALECYKAASKIDPENADYWYGRGLSIAKLGRTEKSLECFDQALTIEPRHQGVLHAKGIGLAALERDEEAIKVFDEALKIEPSNAEAWYHKAESLAKSCHDREALESYDKALERKLGYVNALYGKGICLVRLEQPKDAAECFVEVLKLDPKHTDARQQKGIIDKKLKISQQLDQGMNLAEQGEHAEAIKLYNKLVKSDPENAEIWYRKGVSLLELHQTKKAEQSFSKALELDPQHIDASEAIASIKSKLEHRDEVISKTRTNVPAADEQRTVTESDRRPTKSEPEQKLVLQTPTTGVTQAVDDQSDIAAEVNLQPLIQSEVESWLVAADNLANEGQYTEALLVCEQILERDPQNMKAWIFKGQAFEKLDSIDAACKCFMEAKALATDPQTVRVVLSSPIRELSSQLEDAKRELTGDAVIAEAVSKYFKNDQQTSLQSQFEHTTSMGEKGKLQLTQSAIKFVFDNKNVKPSEIVMPLSQIGGLSKKETWLGTFKYLRIELQRTFFPADYIEFFFDLDQKRSPFILAVENQRGRLTGLHKRIISLEAQLRALQSE